MKYSRVPCYAHSWLNDTIHDTGVASVDVQGPRIECQENLEEKAIMGSTLECPNTLARSRSVISYQLAVPPRLRRKSLDKQHVVDDLEASSCDLPTPFVDIFACPMRLDLCTATAR